MSSASYTPYAWPLPWVTTTSWNPSLLEAIQAFEVNAEIRPRLVTAQHGRAHMVNSLPGRGVVLYANGNGSWALTMTATAGYETVVQLLVERGAPVDPGGGVQYPHHVLTC